jgi:hypothetical protein
MSIKGISWVVKATDVEGWQLCLLHVLIVYKLWEPKTPGAISACSGMYRDSFTFDARHLLLLLLLLLLFSSSLVTGLFFLVLLLNQRCSPPLGLQASHCSTFRIMCDVPSIAVFCSVSIECYYYYYYYYYYYRNYIKT